MKNKMIATVQNIQDDIDSYLNYTTRLAKDFNLNLELTPIDLGITNRPGPAAILGEGLPLPKKVNINLSDKKAGEQNLGFVNATKSLHTQISYEHNDNSIFNRLADAKVLAETLLFTINQKSNDSFFNKLFGTNETEIAKKTILPSLTIPEQCTYNKPKKILVVVRDNPDMDLSQLFALTQQMKLKTVFAYQEEYEKISVQKMIDSIHRSFSESVSSFTSFSLDNEADLLDKIIKYENPEWLAFANYDRSFLERIFKISTNELLLSGKLPILNF